MPTTVSRLLHLASRRVVREPAPPLAEIVMPEPERRVQGLPPSIRRGDRALTIAHLQVGPPEHGICRHGRLLAAEAGRRDDLAVIDRSICLTGEPSSDRGQLRAVARELSAADVVHLQVSVSGDTTWGRNRRSLVNLEMFRRSCHVPVIVTLHDVNNLRSLEYRGGLDWLFRAGVELMKIPLRPAIRLTRQLAQRRFDVGEAFRSAVSFDHLYPHRVARWVLRHSQHVLVASGGEAETLRSLGIDGNVTMIPLFVESGLVREPTGTRPPNTRKTVIVAGFIFKNKGYEVMLHALARLPDVELVLVGGPRLGASGSQTLSQLMSLARDHDVAGRVRVTGYLAEEEYQTYLAEADLAVCPFEPDKSASGSLNSLIAAGCPVLASDVPLIAEYNAIVPGAIPTFSPYTPEGLARAVAAQLAKPRIERGRGLGALRERLSVAEIYDRHLEIYRLCGRRGPSGSPTGPARTVSPSSG
ncbi:MAG TPA: glycosyltransferase [Methylomirabilota bacterium]